MDTKLTKKILCLNGLCCANCAQQIEEGINGLPDVKCVFINFSTQRLTIEITENADIASVLKSVSKIISDLEPGITISEVNEQRHTSEGNRHGKRIAQWLIILGAIIFAVGMIGKFKPQVEFAIFLTSYLLIGWEILLRAIKNITKGKIFDENFLMSIATVGAFIIGEYPEGAAVMLFYQVGEAFQELAVNRSRKSISALMDIRPDFANLKVGDILQKVSPDDVAVGNIIVVKPGEKIPLDGVVIDGKSALDTSALTGESMPKDVGQGNEVLSGSINKNGLLTIKVTKPFGESTVSKILDLVQNASNKKSSTENFITKFARYYTPAIVFAAVALAFIPPLIFSNAVFAEWINRALVFLVVSCPCALVISIPLSFFGGIGGASSNGILIKGSNYMDALNNVDTIIFDKTGTLTKGTFKVTQIVAYDNFSEDEVLYLAAHAESYSTHPIAISIQQSYGADIDKQKISGYEEIAGQGVSVQIDGKSVLAGNIRLINTANIAFNKIDVSGTTVYVAVNGKLAGYIVISDELKSDATAAISELKTLGVKTIAMLTGDNRITADKIAQQIGIDKVFAELLPHQKVEQLEIIDAQKTSDGNVMFVGDGINDAPVLARSDIGVAMGGIGSDAAIEAADVVLMTDEPSKIATAIRIAQKTHTVVWQNIIFALGVKGVILILGALGHATMWEAVFGDVGVAVIAIMNSMRTMRA